MIKLYFEIGKLKQQIYDHQQNLPCLHCIMSLIGSVFLIIKEKGCKLFKFYSSAKLPFLSKSIKLKLFYHLCTLKRHTRTNILNTACYIFELKYWGKVELLCSLHYSKT